PEGVDHVEVCAECHGEIESFEAIRAEEDYDGDGEVESAMAEVEGLMERLALFLPPVGENRVVVTDAYTPAQLRAAYNYLFVEEDGSKGMHNFKYAVGILKAALSDSSNLGVERLDDALPVQFSLGDPYPNPFNAFTTFNYTLPQPTSVKVRIYDIAGKEVKTILNTYQTPGRYKALVGMGDQPAGVYFLKLEAENFTATLKLVLTK
ncbi:MAG: T9SS type A sorting domain-containing protein, partial [bacterium]